MIKETIEKITGLNEQAMKEAKERQTQLLKPPGSLGKLEDISIQLAGIYGKKFYSCDKKAILAFAGDHGIYEEGISVQPQEVTKNHFPNYVKGICSVGIICKSLGAKVVAVDVGIKCDEKLPGIIDRKVAKGTMNMTKGPAMTREQAIKSIEAGIISANELIDEGIEMIGLGEMGICNTSPSSAIVSVITGKNVKEVTGLGAGTMPEGLSHKINMIEKAIEVNKPDKNDGIDVLSKVGGFEIGAMAGVILACAARKIPVVLDGFISYAAAMIAEKLAGDKNIKDYMISSHMSAEPASKLCMDYLNMEPAIHMNMRLGEGSGAAVMFSIIDIAVKVYSEMATFSDTNIPEIKK